MISKILLLAFVAAAQGDMCLRTSDDIVATIYNAADQAMGRGLCTTNDMSNRFNRLERMMSEITTSTSNEINRFISSADNQFRSYQKTVTELTDKISALSSHLGQVEQVIQNFKTWPKFIRTENGDLVPNVYGTPYLQEVDQDFKPTFISANKLVRRLDTMNTARNYEVARYNNTVSSLRGKRVFRYYWTIPSINQVLWASPTGASLRSPAFNIFNNGYRMYLRIHPRQPASSSVSLSLGLAPGENDNALEWPFKLRHYVSVLDRSAMRKDINSKLINPKTSCSYWSWMQPTPGQDNLGCTALTFSSARLLKTPNAFLDNDAMLVRLTVYLEE